MRKKSQKNGFALRPRAGPGRPKGAVNKVGRELRVIVAEFVERNVQDAQALFDRVKKRSPERALKLLIEMQDFVLPRLARTEHRVVAATFTGEPHRISDPVEAATAYQSVIQGLTSPDAVCFDSAAGPQTALPAPSSSDGAALVAQPAERGACAAPSSQASDPPGASCQDPGGEL